MSDITAKPQVRRGVNSVRLAVLALLVAVAVGGGVLWSPLIGLAAAAVLALILAMPFTRHLLMEVAHRMSGT